MFLSEAAPLWKTARWWGIPATDGFYRVRPLAPPRQLWERSE